MKLKKSIIYLITKTIKSGSFENMMSLMHKKQDKK